MSDQTANKKCDVIDNRHRHKTYYKNTITKYVDMKYKNKTKYLQGIGYNST